MAFGSGGGCSHPAPRRTGPQQPESTASGESGLPHPAHRAASPPTILADTLADASKQALASRLGGGHLTVREVAGRLRVSTATVYSLCHRGELEHQRVSNAIRIPESALARYLDAAAASGAGPRDANDERGG